MRTPQIWGVWYQQKSPWEKNIPPEIWFYFGLIIFFVKSSAHPTRKFHSPSRHPSQVVFALCPGHHRQKGRQHRDHRNLASCHFQNGSISWGVKQKLRFPFGSDNSTHFTRRFDCIVLYFLLGGDEMDDEDCGFSSWKTKRGGSSSYFSWFHDLIDRHIFYLGQEYAYQYGCFQK